MTNEQIIEMAKQARLKDWWDSGNENYETFTEHLHTFAQLVRNAALDEPAVEPVAAQHRFRHPHKTTPDWSHWRECPIANRVARYTDSLGYEIEYRNLYATPVREPAPPPPAERDVCKIMLEVVPGADGMGHEVYAKNVSEVVNKLTEMGQRIEDLEGASPPAEHGCKFPMCQTEEYQQMLEAQVARELIGVPLLSDEEIEQADDSMCGEREFSKEFARAIEAAVRRKAGL